MIKRGVICGGCQRQWLAMVVVSMVASGEHARQRQWWSKEAAVGSVVGGERGAWAVAIRASAWLMGPWWHGQGGHGQE
ncbi:hypothetical protein CRG98_045428 [Punica granatum]|uniref:Uncharacterized protein n=1 Tax=Punica granatum TaxID=22663 RepID=A0A2I0HR36_PUNGR|nr:hypothetical protein CRG98_045428 [Punica granatum]